MWVKFLNSEALVDPTPVQFWTLNNISCFHLGTNIENLVRMEKGALPSFPALMEQKTPLAGVVRPQKLLVDIRNYSFLIAV